MPEPMYSILRVLHPGGMFLAFGVAPIALLSIKGEQRHIIAGRCFAIGMLVGAGAGLLLATVRSDPVVDLILLGLLTVFFTGTASLAPRVARRSRTAWRWDRVLTGLGITAAVAMLGSTVGQQSFPVIFDSLVVGSFGLWIGIAHWRGPTDPYHWQVEHLTGMLSAYLVVWWFVFWLYIRALPRVSQTLIPAVPAVGAMLWARRRFAVAPAAPAAWPTRPAIHADQPGS